MNLTDKTVHSAPPAKPGADDSKVAPAAQDPKYVANKVTKAAEDFESFFISHMLHQVRTTTRELSPEDSVFRDPVNSDMMDMADDMLAGKMAGQRAFGIADAILRQLLPKKA